MYQKVSEPRHKHLSGAKPKQPNANSEFRTLENRHKHLQQQQDEYAFSNSEDDEDDDEEEEIVQIQI